MLQALKIEGEHVCPGRLLSNPEARVLLEGGAHAEKAPAIGTLVQEFLNVSSPSRTPWPAAIAAAVLFLYALPAVAKMIAVQHVNVWAACIIPGDLVGCICIGTMFKKPRIAILLYLTLTAVEGYLHAAHLLPEAAFVWLVDLVPTLTVAALVIYRTRAAEIHTVFPDRLV
jgi:hypothetical protein